MTIEVLLRPVGEPDLPIFFAHQRDADAVALAAFPSRERDAFFAHWKKILSDETVLKKTILGDGAVVGNVVSFGGSGAREVGYWIGKQYWGMGIARRALVEFLRYETARPLRAGVAKHNIPSIRVLEKCGFRQVGEEREFAKSGDTAIPGLIFELTESR